MRQRVIWITLLLSWLWFCSPGLSYADTGRYISLAPATTEILFSLGLGQEIVGVSSFCNFPADARGKEKVGSFSQPNIERIIYLKPDLVFCTGLEQSPTVEKLRILGIAVCVSAPESLEALFKSITEIGALTRRQNEAMSLIQSMRKELGIIQARVKGVAYDRRPTVLLEIWHDPLLAAGGKSLIDEMIRLAGGINIMPEGSNTYTAVSPEFIIKRNPDCIILTYMDSKEPAVSLKKRLGWERISAVSQKRVYNDINPDILLRPGPRVIEAITALHKRFYPE